MRHIHDQFSEPADHLALDEALLIDGELQPPVEDEANNDASRPRDQALDCWGESLRIWEFDRPVVVAGRSTRVNEEIDCDRCRERGIPILRRCSGGASVVAGPGCLMYSVVLSIERDPSLRRIDVTHEHVMGRLLAALQEQIPDAQHQGICDLTWQNRKCSGNSLRMTRTRLLYHGTILYNFDLQLIEDCLLHAPRQPDYRGGRSHEEFVTNVDIAPDRFAQMSCRQFDVQSRQSASPWMSQMRELTLQRYGNSNWNYRH